MKLPFTMEQFLQLFEKYNGAIFPLQILFYLLALAIIFLSVKGTARANKTINSILAFFWLWMGIVYHLIFFTAINKAAYVFGALFITQAILFFYYGVIKQELRYRLTKNIFGVMGMILVTFALVVYPVVGYLYGHVYPSAPTFGLPCPTTIFTFGILMLSERKFAKPVLIIPFLWSLLGFSAATSLGIKEDTALLVAGFSTTVVLLFRKQHMQTVKNWV